MSKIHQALQENFGFSGFRNGQEKIIQELLQGNSALAVFPTGSGKSLCYQLSALLMDGITLVVSPLIALMKDQVDFLQAKNIAAAKIDSTLSYEELRQVWTELEENKLKLLYIAPERLTNEAFVQRLQKYKISMLVIDEAHCMSEWGHNFRPDYLKLKTHAEELRVERVLALTATATPQVAKDICLAFNILPQAYVNTGYHRPNLFFRMTMCNFQEKKKLLLKRFRESPTGAAIVYVTLQKEAEDIAHFLSSNGYPASAYHAGIKGDERHEVQEDFMTGKSRIVVATIAFGMGVDKSDIRYVYHFNIPKSMENYAQETGRAGRDGAPSICEVFCSQSDSIVLKNFIYGDTPTAESIRDLLENILNGDREFALSIYHSSTQFDIRPLVLNTLLCYLELEGFIQSTGHFYNNVQFQPKMSSKEMFELMTPEKVLLLKGIFRRAQKGRTWFTLLIDELEREINTPRKVITDALNELSTKELITTQVKDVRVSFRRLQETIDIPQLTQKLHKRYTEAERRDVERVEQIVQLASSQNCLVRSTLAYFGEELGQNCGHCDRCTQTVETYGELQEKVQWTPENQQVLSGLKDSHPLLFDSRNLAKFLCGISSPSMSFSRPALTKHPRFGALANVPFELILKNS